MIYVTPSEIIEYLYCPRFIYFMNVLKIEQHEDKRFLVNKGRNMHEMKLVRNKKYLRKKIGCKDKELDVYLTSRKYKLVGKIDEVLFFEENFAAPLDYKYAFWNKRVYQTYKMQQILYALLIEDNYDYSVNKGYIVYIRSKNFLKEIKITDNSKAKALDIVNDVFKILNENYFPKKTSYKKRCNDCTYKNICVK